MCGAGAGGARGTCFTRERESSGPRRTNPIVFRLHSHARAAWQARSDDLQLRHLRYFDVVADALNLSRAAATLHVAQPALSRTIHDLEKELGVALLERHAKGVSLTLAGDAFTRGGRELLGDIAGALDRAEATASGRSGRVVIGVPRGIMALGFVTALSDWLRREHPEIVLVARDSSGEEGADDLRSGAIDVSLGFAPLEDVTLMREELWVEIANRAMLPAVHPLATRECVDVGELHELPLLIPIKMPPSVIVAGLEQLRAAGLRSTILTLDSGIHSAHLMVAANRGWILATAALANAPPAGTAMPRLNGVNLLLPVVVVWRRKDRRPVVRTVLDGVAHVVRQYASCQLRADPAFPSPPQQVNKRAPGSLPITLDFRHLRALLEVSAAQTIGRAAKRLGVTQPALSRQLRDLERAAGVALLERSASGVTLTAAGTSLASECPAILGSAEHLARDATRSRRGMEGRCAVGAVATTIAGELLATALMRCAMKHPHVQVTVDEVASPAQPAALLEGRIDVGLAHASQAAANFPQVRTEMVLQDRVDAALVGVDHRLARRAELTARDLADVPLLFMERSFHPAQYDQTMDALARIGLTPLVEATYDGLQSVWALAAQGEGWCLGFHSQFAHPPIGTVAVRIRGMDIPWGLELLWRREETNAAVLAVVGQFIHAKDGAAHTKKNK